MTRRALWMPGGAHRHQVTALLRVLRRSALATLAVAGVLALYLIAARMDMGPSDTQAAQDSADDLVCAQQAAADAARAEAALHDAINAHVAAHPGSMTPDQLDRARANVPVAALGEVRVVDGEVVR